MRSSPVDKTCAHCGAGGTAADVRMTDVEHRGGRLVVPLCIRCRTTPDRWVRYQPVETIPVPSRGAPDD
jgi:hypothetical protein